MRGFLSITLHFRELGFRNCLHRNGYILIYVPYAAIPNKYMQSPVGNPKIDSTGEERLCIWPPRFGSWLYEIN